MDNSGLMRDNSPFIELFIWRGVPNSLKVLQVGETYEFVFHVAPKKLGILENYSEMFSRRLKNILAVWEFLCCLMKIPIDCVDWKRKIISPQKFTNFKNPNARKDLGESFAGCLRKFRQFWELHFAWEDTNAQKEIHCCPLFWHSEKTVMLEVFGI